MGAQSFLSRQASAKATEVNGRASSGFADKLAATEALLREAAALGAEAVQMGTRFVSCAESPVHANYKNAIVQAPTTGTWMLNTKASPCIRALKSQRTQAIHEAGLMPADSFAGIQRVYFDGDMEAAPALAGQTAGLIDSVKTAQQIIDDTVAEFFAISQRMGALAAARSFG